MAHLDRKYQLEKMVSIRVLRLEDVEEEEISTEPDESEDIKSQQAFIQKTMWNQLRSILRKKKDPSKKKKSKEVGTKSERTRTESVKQKEKEDKIRQSDKLASNSKSSELLLPSPRKSIIATGPLDEDKEEKEKKIRAAVAHFAGTRKPEREKSVPPKRPYSDKSSQPHINVSASSSTSAGRNQTRMGGKLPMEGVLEASRSSDSNRSNISMSLLTPNNTALQPCVSEILTQSSSSKEDYDDFDFDSISASASQYRSELLGLDDNIDLLQKLGSHSNFEEVEASKDEVFSQAQEVVSNAKMERLGGGSRTSCKGGLELPNGEYCNIDGRTLIDVISQVGKGATATVFKAVLQEQIVALKIISLMGVKDRKKMRQILAAEVEMMKELRHPNVIRYYGHFYSGKEIEMNIIMEYVEGGALSKYIQRQKKLSEVVTAHLLHQVLCGLCFLHNNSIIHRDLKPDNMLVDVGCGLVKLIDFGTATKVLVRSCRRSVVGTPWYTAPEVIKEEEYSYPADIWSLGCSAIEILSGKPPYADLNAIAALFSMAETPPLIPDDLSPRCKDFLTVCLTLDRRKRPSAPELLGSKFFGENIKSSSVEAAISVIEGNFTEEQHYESDYLQIIKNLDSSLHVD